MSGTGYFSENALVKASLYLSLDINITLQRNTDFCLTVAKIFQSINSLKNNLIPSLRRRQESRLIITFYTFPPLLSAHLPSPISGRQAVGAQTKLFSCHGYRYRKVILLTFSGGGGNGGGFKWRVALRGPFREALPEQQGARREDGEEQEKVRAAC